MMECKFCGAEVQINQICAYCGRVAEACYYPGIAVKPQEKSGQAGGGYGLAKWGAWRRKRIKAYYTVKKGDCLWNIAKEFYGNPLLHSVISSANKIKNPNHIKPGMVLEIPEIERRKHG